MEVSVLERSRRTARRAMSRLETDILNLESPSLGDIETFKIRIAETKQNFDRAQSQIEEQCKEDEFEATMTCRDEFEDMYFKSLGCLLNMTMVNNTNNTSMVSNNIINAKLPKLNIIKFNGDIEKWQEFSDVFKNAIHENRELSDVIKLQYLKSALEGEPSEMIRSLQLTHSNYEIAWEILVKRYENKRLVAFQLYQRLFRLERMDRDPAKQLVTLLNGVIEGKEALKTLHCDSFDKFLYFLLYTKLDEKTRNEFEMTINNNEIPELDSLIQHLTKRNVATRMTQLQKNTENNQRTKSLQTNDKRVNSASKPGHTVSHFASANCQICNDNHTIYRCTKFMSSPVKERVSLAREHHLCFNCLTPRHFNSKCSSLSRCKTCQKKHHTLLHLDKSPTTTESEPTQSTTALLGTTQTKGVVLLSTASVWVPNVNGKSIICRALLDSASQSNFITKSCASKLGLKLKSQQTVITGISDTVSKGSHMIDCTIRSRTSDSSYNIQATVLPKITIDLPTAPITITDWKPFDNISLADPMFCTPGKIDILLGAGVFFETLRGGLIRPPGGPVLKESTLGWVAAGNCSAAATSVCHSVCCVASLSVRDHEDDLRGLLAKFWELEEIPNSNSMSKEEVECEQYYNETTKRNSDGRYVVMLPFKRPTTELGDSKSIALKRYRQIRAKFRLEPQTKIQYEKFMSEYLNLGHMKLVTNSDSTSGCYYLPHHCVFKLDSTTTKLRVVFDGSLKPACGASLNDILLVGPTLQDTLFSIMLRFRYHKYALVGDIEKMYRQIKINDEHINYQRIIWSFDEREPPDEYCLTTVTYGTSSASYLAIKTLYQLAKDEGHRFPLAASILKRDMYVDDLITSFSTIDEAIQAQSQMNKLLNMGGFSMRKWASNDDRILYGVPLEDREFQVAINVESSTRLIKTLGVYWNPVDDYFQFQFNTTELSVYSKRSILAQIARIYDPLGLLSPVVIKAKIFIQKLWLSNLNWDDSLPQNLQDEWMEINYSLSNARNITISRYISNLEHIDIMEIHGFCDASINAYAACIYVRSISSKGIATQLLCSKVRVAPLKQVSIPRLELCGAVLLSKLLRTVIASIAEIERYYLWTDSKIVLSWLQGEPRRWKTFVANR